jgi:hypothetical protein
MESPYPTQPQAPLHGVTAIGWSSGPPPQDAPYSQQPGSSPSQGDDSGLVKPESLVQAVQTQNLQFISALLHSRPDAVHVKGRHIGLLNCFKLFLMALFSSLQDLSVSRLYTKRFYEEIWIL